MFLYFYEANMIARFNHHHSITLEKRDNFDMDCPKKNDHRFNGWEAEENEDGTFCLVFIKKGIKYYLQQTSPFGFHTLRENNTMHLCNFIHDADTIRMFENKKYAQKLLLSDDGTFVFYNEKNDKFELLPYLYQNGLYDKGLFRLIFKKQFTWENEIFPLSNKVCLTRNSNMGNGYVLK